jgi:mono/diheme cytochrome c family protein
MVNQSGFCFFECMTKRTIIPATVLLCSLILWVFLGVHSLAGDTALRTEGEKIYTHYCSPCHGVKGDGKGFNAKNLDPRPANHADAEFMAKRTDKELADAISGGGRFVGKSSLMPPWGETLSRAQIRNLVMYMRKLCQCEGG